jgi:hypothetical protein
MTSIQIKVPNWLDRVFAWPAVLYRLWKFGYAYRRIYLDEDKWTILDTDDYYRFGKFKWCLNGYKDKYYAIRSQITGPKDIRIVRLHRLIMNAPDGVLVDHINSNSLDNRRSNLRLATRSQNMSNRKKTKIKTTSQYIGVSFEKSRGLWVTTIRNNNKSIWIGRFDSEIEAARAYDRAAIKYHGEFARLNFAREDYNIETPTTNVSPG